MRLNIAWTTPRDDMLFALWLLEINRFKDDLKKATEEAGKTPIDFGSGLWRIILDIKDRLYGGRVLDRLPPVSVAEEVMARSEKRSTIY